MKETLKAVIYARYSSDNQREESIEGQIRDCQEYAKYNNITIVGSYIDRAMSAKTDNRPNFQQMIKDSAKRLFDVVIVWKLDRFARNRFDSAYYKNTLKKNGVKVISAKESISEGAEGIILESVLEGYAEYYSVELAEKVNRGLTDNALKGLYNGSVVPLGYYVDENQRLCIDEEKAPFVREIFQRFADGEMIKDIIKAMNARGVGILIKMKNKAGKKSHIRPLQYNSVRNMLTNRKYIGEYKYKDIVIENGVPAIIEKELFYKVQKRIALNRRAPAMHKAKEEYLLTTKLFCGKCNAMMRGESGRSRNGKIYTYYKCASQKKRHTCDKKTISKETIENAVVKAIMAKVMDDNLMEDLSHRLYELQNQENGLLKSLQTRLAEVEQGIENMLNAIQNGIVFDSTKKRLAELEEQKKELSIEITKEQMERPMLTREQILFGVHKFRKCDIETKEGKERLINGFVNSVYLFDDYALITCNFCEETMKITIEDIENSFFGDFIREQKNKPEQKCSDLFGFGGAKRIRTAGLLVANEALYQLSHNPKSITIIYLLFKFVNNF